MGLADKYRKNLAETTSSFFDKEKKSRNDRKKLEDEEKRKRDEWSARRKKLMEKEAENEVAMVGILGNVVMASGFVDTFGNDFSLLSGILAFAMKEMEEDTSVKDKFLACSIIGSKSVKKKKEKVEKEKPVEAEGTEADTKDEAGNDAEADVKAADGVTVEEPKAGTDKVDDEDEIVEDAGMGTGDDVISEAI